ncbi:MAG TPA: FAD-dependent oxidoreductase [Phenylobacterium sp.]|uniref:NAD(P)/FAD-dependent oxidoreductase n=1 Tax=Phenylobacterium sp. TaxID=1871053 RepID=UPI002D0B1FC9|nr:FAD-dependent oxidoreductase [Phenylobacterium sp.]HSV04825.1 FAD-dependent oxidoreductase [Phenylobacterium sp.]
MTGGAKVTVAGAGALGLCTALALADSGCRVEVADPDPRANASAVAAGMLAPVFEAVLDPEVAPAFDLLIAARDLWPGLEARAGVRLDRSGAMAVGDETWLAGVQASLVRLGLHGIDLPRRTAGDLAPGLAPDARHALLVREDWRLEPRQALAALRASAEAAGVAFRGEAVRDLGGADWLVVATGAGQALADLAPEIAMLAPIKGQILRYSEVRRAGVSVRGDGVYATPSSEGLAIGATMEPGASDSAPDRKALQPLVTRAAALFPALAGAKFAVSAGVRAATADALPLVGLSANAKVILAVGARRNGWLLAPLVAQVVAACVSGRDAGMAARRFDPARFAEGFG